MPLVRAASTQPSRVDAAPPAAFSRSPSPRRLGRLAHRVAAVPSFPWFASPLQRPSRLRGSRRPTLAETVQRVSGCFLASLLRATPQQLSRLCGSRRACLHRGAVPTRPYRAHTSLHSPRPTGSGESSRLCQPWRDPWLLVPTLVVAPVVPATRTLGPALALALCTSFAFVSQSWQKQKIRKVRRVIFFIIIIYD